MTLSDHEFLLEKHTRMHQAVSVVGSLVLPLEDEARVLDVIVEQLIRAARMRSLVLAIVYQDRGYLDVVREARFNKISPEGRVTTTSVPTIERKSDWREALDDPHSMLARAARVGKVVIADGNDPELQALPDYNPDQWTGRVAYFISLQHVGEKVAVLAGACPLEDADTALDWFDDLAPLIELVGAHIRTLRVLREQRFLAYRPPIEIHLSDREREVLRRVALGESSADIAEAMALSPRTVHTYRRRICNKLDRHTQADLTRYAIMAGLIPLTDR